MKLKKHVKMINSILDKSQTWQGALPGQQNPTQAEKEYDGLMRRGQKLGLESYSLVVTKNMAIKVKCPMPREASADKIAAVEEWKRDAADFFMKDLRQDD